MPNPRLIKKAREWMNPECPEVRESKTQEPKDLNLSARIVAGDYIQIPNSTQIISKFELQGYNNLNWNDTHFKLNENRLYMPIVPIFMNHFINVLDCYQNKKLLFDAQGNEIPRKELEDIYKHLTTNHIAVYEAQGGGQEGCWTWLDAKFREETGKWFVDYNHRVFSGQLKARNSEQLEDCLGEDCFAELQFNKQGMATKKSSNQNYWQGKNIKFWHPRNGTVAWFDAYINRASFYCNGDPSYRNSSLGVFGCAEGAQS